MVEKSQDKEMDKSVAVGNVENNSEKEYFQHFKHLTLPDLNLKQLLYKRHNGTLIKKSIKDSL